MAKQTFTTGQVLTAAQMTSLQQTAMGGGSATAKTASYTLVAADAGTTVIMNSASATTITVNTSLFSAGDTVFIQNIGAGVSTITAGTATVDTASSLALAQYESGNLYFTAASAAIFSKADGAAAGGGGKVLQVVSVAYSTSKTVSSTTYTDSDLTLNITPTSATSKIMIIVSLSLFVTRDARTQGAKARIMRGATSVADFGGSNSISTLGGNGDPGDGYFAANAIVGLNFLDSPATTSATTYKVQIAAASTANFGSVIAQLDGATSTMTLLEIGA